MVINPYEEDQNIYTVYPQLKQVTEPYAEDLPDINWHQYFRYLSFVYDPNSPMVREYQQVEKRKLAAAEEVGYQGEHHHCFAVEFVKKIVRNKVWTLICNMDFVFDEYTDKLNVTILGVDPDKTLKAVEMKNKMITQQVEMIPNREDLFKRLFDDDKDMEEMEGKLTWTAENIAMRVKK